jgi:DNA-binding transcriptional MerR regulator
MADSGRVRIGVLSRRVGESPEVLRAWETRYGLVAPERTPGGLRLYSEQDERRVRAMQNHIAAGLSASEAARLAKRSDEEGPQPVDDASLTDLFAALERSFDTLDEPGAQLALDRLFVSYGLEPALGDVILPFLHRLGTRWANAETTVGQEHFASHVIAGRLRGLTRGWGDGGGPLTVLACPPGELHDLGLLAFGLALHGRGWRIAYLGAQTPIEEIARVAAELTPAIVVLSATTPERFLDVAGELSTLASDVRVGIGGAGASAEIAERLGAEWLGGDVIKVAAGLLS